MSLHPIKALDHVIDEYADYLRTEFREDVTGLQNQDPSCGRRLSPNSTPEASWPRSRSIRPTGPSRAVRHGGSYRWTPNWRR